MEKAGFVDQIELENLVGDMNDALVLPASFSDNSPDLFERNPINSLAKIRPALNKTGGVSSGAKGYGCG